MAFILSGLGVMVSIGFIIAGAVMNWRYGLGLGRTVEDQQLNAGVHLLIDLCKVMMPFFGWWAFAQRRMIVAAGAALVTVAAILYSAIGIAGFVDMSRAVTSGSMIATKDNVGDWRTDLERSQRRLKDLGSYQPASVIEQRLRQIRQDGRWQTSKQCTEATAKTSREFCADVSGLEAEKAKALEAGKLEARVQDLREKINTNAGMAAIERGDPRADIVARTTGWELLRVQTWLSLLLVGIVEFMATFGIFLSLNHGEVGRIMAARRERRAQKRHDMPAVAPLVTVKRDIPRPVAVERGTSRPVATNPDVRLIEHLPVGQLMRYISSETAPATGGIELLALHTDYVRWCAATKVAAMDLATFEAELDRLRELPEVGKHLTKFGTRYIGLGLQHDAATAVRKRRTKGT